MPACRNSGRNPSHIHPATKEEPFSEVLHNHRGKVQWKCRKAYSLLRTWISSLLMSRIVIKIHIVNNVYGDYLISKKLESYSFKLYIMIGWSVNQAVESREEC